MSNLDITSVSRQGAEGTYVFGTHPTWGSRTFTGDLLSLLESNSVDPLNISSEMSQRGQIALIKAYAKMNETAVQAPVVLHEMEETIKMLRRPFKGFQTHLKQMFKARKRSLKRSGSNFAKVTADTWLEYRYGWRPLMMDAENIAVQAITQRHKIERERHVARSGSSVDRTMAKTEISGSAIPLVSGGELRTTFKKEGRVAAGVVYDVVHRTSQEQLMKDFGTRTNDLPSNAWEAIPYSFVVDWFVGVGDWLRAITPDPDVVVQGNWITTIIDATDKCSGDAWISVATAPATTYRVSLGSSVRKSLTVVRRTNQPMATHPLSKVNWPSLTQRIDGLALLTKPILDSLVHWRH